MLMILETKMIFAGSALIVPLDKDVLNIKEYCYGINPPTYIKSISSINRFKLELKLYLQNNDLD